MTDKDSSLRLLLKKDLPASIVVFLVALPLCMGIAMASGAPIAAGLITGIVAGLLVAPLAGCPLQVSGPAAGLTVIVYDAIQRHGFEMLGIIVLVAGVVQLLAGGFRLGPWFRAVSPSVVEGMLAGIGVLLIASQLHVMVDDRPRSSATQNILSIPEAFSKGFTFPDWITSDNRSTRTHLLHTIGDLHRRQIKVQQTIEEHLLDEQEKAEIAVTPPGPTTTEGIILEEIAAEQEAIHKDLAAQMELLASVSKENGSQDGAEGSGRIEQLATAAFQKTEVALKDLRERTVADLAPSQAESVAALEALRNSLKNHSLAAQIGILTIVVLLLWQGATPKSLKVIPAPLVAVLLATLITAIFAMPVLYVEAPSSLWGELAFPSFTTLRNAPWGGLIQTALVIAVVASAETLLSATAVDQLHQGPRARYDRELMAQGVGNVACGLLGGLPMTGVIVRSSANVKAGAATRWSAFLHGVWLLLFVSAFGFLLSMIPTASLAALLVYTGYKLVNPRSILQLWKHGWGEVVIYATTVVTIVVTDLLTGVLVGIALAAVKLLHSIARLHARLEIQPEGGRAVLRLEGAATFIRLPKLAAVLERVPRGAELHVQFDRLDYIDHACLQLLTSWARQHEAAGGSLVIDWGLLHANFHRNQNGRRLRKEPPTEPVQQESGRQEEATSS